MAVLVVRLKPFFGAAGNHYGFATFNRFNSVRKLAFGLGEALVVYGLGWPLLKLLGRTALSWE